MEVFVKIIDHIAIEKHLFGWELAWDWAVDDEVGSLREVIQLPLIPHIWRIVSINNVLFFGWIKVGVEVRMLIDFMTSLFVDVEAFPHSSINLHCLEYSLLTQNNIFSKLIDVPKALCTKQILCECIPDFIYHNNLFQNEQVVRWMFWV